MNRLNTTPFHQHLLSFDDGAYDVMFNTKRYLFRKETHLDGKLVKVYANELGGNDFISLNYYPETLEGLLKPCEMAEQKVIDFVNRAKRINP